MRRLLIVVLALAGCGAPWAIVRQAAPNPFRAEARFWLAPVESSDLRVRAGTVAQHLERKSADSRRSFRQDLSDFDALFRAELLAPGGRFTASPDGARFSVRTRLRHWEPGIWSVANARAELTVEILDEDDRVLDEVDLYASEIPNALTPSSGDRMRSCAMQLGAQLRRYLDERAAGGRT